MEIKPVIRSDIPAIREIFNEVLRNTNSIYREVEASLEDRYAWFDGKTQEGFPIFGAYEGERLIGYASYGVWRSAQGYKKTVELTIHIEKPYRGKGVGSLLMRSLIEQAEDDGFHAMIAAIDSENQGSLDFHKKFGFFESARMPEVALKNGKWLTLVFMQKLL